VIGLHMVQLHAIGHRKCHYLAVDLRSACSHCTSSEFQGKGWGVVFVIDCGCQCHYHCHLRRLFIFIS